MWPHFDPDRSGQRFPSEIFPGSLLQTGKCARLFDGMLGGGLVKHFLRSIRRLSVQHRPRCESGFLLICPSTIRQISSGLLSFNSGGKAEFGNS